MPAGLLLLVTCTEGRCGLRANDTDSSFKGRNPHSLRPCASMRRKHLDCCQAGRVLPDTRGES
ncbi:hypothetical protein HaLaN_19559 [Haematococcus lacustris]|uniref:Uncharacterized protein n=1 Tax=Haematococcus lacustris TaxID=44745 RepID=A0A699ZIM2_HAELA|nr:hypothetical protein HaLaN_19559 [Haematococcus lacustris]